MTNNTPCSTVKDLIVEKCIGRGTYGIVYEAYCTKSGEKVALKKVYIADMKDDKARNDCMNELHLLQRLKHPRIIQYMFCEISNDDVLHMVLELAAGGDLSVLIAERKRNCQLISEKSLWTFAEQISSALCFMHSNRIMHRENNSVKLGDLGLSKYFAADSKSAYSVLGSPYYMSPERLLHEKYYMNSDIWSLGCVLYELAALQSPFYVNILDMSLLIKKVTHCDYPPVPADLYSEKLSEVIEECLSIDYNKRPSAECVYKKVTEYMDLK